MNERRTGAKLGTDERTGVPSLMPVLVARGIRKSYRGGDGGVIRVLDGVELEVVPGQMVAIVGASGAGKSTLLHVVGGLDRPDEGEVVVDGVLLAERDEAELAAIRNRKIGFVFQFHHLLREFSALENVMMPLRIAGVGETSARRRAEELLGLVGLADRLHHRPGELSGGEQQRTAVARALAADPALLLADEPSGNLDHPNAERLHDLLASLARDLEIGVVVATHNRSLAGRADRILLLEDGVLAETDVRGLVG
jgi:lipoprotein-releasing system ATP-binding protein